MDLLKSRVISEDYAQFYHKQSSTDCLPAHLEQESENEEENCEDDIHETAASNEPPPANADEKVSDETHSNCDTPTIVTIEFCKHLTSGDSNGYKRLLCPVVSRRRNGTEHNQSASETFPCISASVPAAPVKRAISGGTKDSAQQETTQGICRAVGRRCKRTVHNQSASETFP